MNILLVAHNEYLPLYVLQCLRGLNFKIFVLGNGKIHPAKLSKHCSRYMPCSKDELKNPKAIFLKKIALFCHENQIEIIIPSDIETFFFISKIKNKIKKVKLFPVANYSTLRLLNNKWDFTSLLEKHSLPHPKSFLINTIEDLDRMNLNFPIVIKPLELDGGKGVIKIISLKIAKHYLSLTNQYNAYPLIAQEYATGEDGGISILARDGKILASTVQRRNGNGGIIFIENPYILSLAKQIVLKTKFSGTGHIDLRINTKNGSVKILEFNPRFWGSMLASKKSGVNFAYLGLLLTQNLPIDKYIQRKKLEYYTTKVVLKNKLGRQSGSKYQENLFNTDLFEMIADPIPYIYLTILENLRPIKPMLLDKPIYYLRLFFSQFSRDFRLQLNKKQYPDLQ